MDRVLWGIVVPFCLLGLVVVYGVCYRLIPETVPIQDGVFVPRMVPSCHPEPREDAQYVAAIVVTALLLFCGAAMRFHVGAAATSAWVGCLALTLQVLVVFFVAAMIVWQETQVYQYLRYDKIWLVFAAACLVLVMWLALRKSWHTWVGRRLAQGFSWKSAAWLAAIAPYVVALVATAVGLSCGIYRDRQPQTAVHFLYHVRYHMAEFAAVQNGHTPYVDFFPQYESCISYFTLPLFRVFGLDMLSFTLVMTAMSALTLAVFYFVFRRLTGGGGRALLLYLPFLGACCFPIYPNNYEPDLPLHQMATPFTYFAVGPLRYFGPCMTLACLSAALHRPTRFRFVFLFCVGALTAINNLDFGFPALAAATISVALAISPRTLPSLRHLCSVFGCLAIGVAIAVSGFAGITYARAGQLPDFKSMLMFQRIFALNGFSALPMPAAGFHVVVMLTFLAAIAKALYTSSLTPFRKGMLLYAGVFGCGALMYYVVRSHPHVLVNLFLAWAFAFLLQTWLIWEEAVEKLRMLGWRGAFQPIALLMTVGYLMLSSTVGALPNPRHQWLRVTARRLPKPSECDMLTDEIRSLKASGESIVVIHAEGHLACLRAGVPNPFPYASFGSLILYSQYDQVMNIIDTRHIRYVIDGDHQPLMPSLLLLRGYEIIRQSDCYAVYRRPDDVPANATATAAKGEGVE
jgi:hypothetical protein